MNWFKELRRSLFIAAAFAVITFPIMVIRINTISDTIEWQWSRLILVAVGCFVTAFSWGVIRNRQEARAALKQKGVPDLQTARPPDETLLDRVLGRIGMTRSILKKPQIKVPAIVVLIGIAIAFPFVTSLYQTNIIITALIFVILGLGLNIVVGLGGLLHLGYAAFYAIGAYTYALLNRYLGINFWVALPLGALVSAGFGILLAVPVMRLRGDYLAIVTLAFGEIIRLVIRNWDTFTSGPAGVKDIPRPGFFGMELNMNGAINLTYFICLAVVIITIFLVNRLENSRIGRQWVAMGEDDIAARAMGVNTTRAKITAFAIGAVWAGLAGVLFAAKTTVIVPDYFDVWKSVLVLCMVVLGGMGSIPGVIVGALILSLLPEYMRVFSDYKWLLIGGVLVIMMVFRPEGMIPRRLKHYRLNLEDVDAEEQP